MSRKVLVAGLDKKDVKIIPEAIVLPSGPGAGTALEFSLELVRTLAGPKKASEIAEKILARS